MVIIFFDMKERKAKWYEFTTIISEFDKRRFLLTHKAEVYAVNMIRFRPDAIIEYKKLMLIPNTLFKPGDHDNDFEKLPDYTEAEVEFNEAETE